MNKILYSACLLFIFSIQGNSQTVTIPDTNFLNALIAQGVDTSGDGMIQISEAVAINDLDLDDKNITSLVGIDAFTNLKILSCRKNN